MRSVFLLTVFALAAGAAGLPKGYVCHRARRPIRIDGRLDEAAWRSAAWTDRFVDIEGDAKPRPRWSARVKMLWDDEFFYIAAEMEEPHVWGTLTRHDAVIFQDNDFEVFIDPDGDNHQYYELEINALNTTWDLFLPKPYKDGGKAANEWEIAGLKTAVFVDGTLNDAADRDRGWSVEMALPWKALAAHAHRAAPPADGDQWRVNFSRVQWQHEIVEGKYRKVAGKREDNWVWSPQGTINMHRPERWGYVQFSTAAPGRAEFRPDPTGPARDLLHQIYYAQTAYRRQHQRWAASLRDLGLDAGDATLRATEAGFEAAAGDLRIREDSLIWSEAAARKSLAEARRRIDQIDLSILDWLNDRTRAALEIGWRKQQLQLPIQDAAREKQVLANLAEKNQGPLPSEAVQRIFERIVQEMRSAQTGASSGR